MDKEYIHTKSRRKAVIGMRLPVYLLILSFFMAACSSVDCELNRLVYTQYGVLNAAGEADTLFDTLTISTNRIDGSDSVIINRNERTTGFSLPISYAQPEDVFFFEMKDSFGTVRYDTVKVAKEDMMHFESVDCTPSYFHTLTGVSYTTNNIDSITITNPDVNYDTSKKHFNIYFKHRD